VEKRVFFILFVAGLMLMGGAALAQEDAPMLEDPYAEEEPPAEGGEGEKGAEGEKKAEEAPAEGEEKAEEKAEEEGEEKGAEEAPAAGEEKAEEAAPAAAEAPAETEEAAVEEEAEEEAAEEAAEEAPAEEAETDETEEGEGDEEGEEEAKKPFRRTFAGTAIYWDNSFSAVSLDKSHDYTYNPNYTMGFGFIPMWNVTDSFSLSSNIGFSVELTNSDFSNKRNEVFFSDIPINASYRYKVNINEDVMFSTGLNGGFLLPTSRMSRYATLYTALTIGTGATFIFPKVLQGLSIGWKPSFRKYFHASENPKFEGNPLDDSPIPDTEKATSEQYQALAYSPGENPSWKINNGLSLSLGIWETLSFTFGYTHGYTYKYAATNTASDEPEDDCAFQPEGCDPVRDTGHNERGVYSQMFLYSFDYTLPDPVHMVGLSLGAITATNQLAPDGQYRTPFFNRETVISFGVTIDIDTMINKIQGGEESEEEKQAKAMEKLE
jgi:hypothetical protein